MDNMKVIQKINGPILTTNIFKFNICNFILTKIKGFNLNNNIHLIYTIL